MGRLAQEAGVTNRSRSGGDTLARTCQATIVVLSLAAALVVPPVAAAQPVPEVARIAGADRIATAVAVSASGWDAAGTVVLATAGAFADALAAGALVADLDAPLLLTPSDRLPDVVATEVVRLGADRAVLLGGPAAIAESVAEQLRGLGLDVDRIAGPDRFATAAAVADAAGLAGEVVIALGSHPEPDRAWPDALSAGAFAAVPEAPPLLLVGPSEVPAATRESLAGRAMEQAHVIGGQAAISADVAAELGTMVGRVSRLAGPSRYATSAAVATEVLGRLAAQVPLYAASGANFPDGLATAALAARGGGVLVLVPPARLADAPQMRDFLVANRHRFSSATVVGGPAAVSDAAVADLAAALGSESPEGWPNVADPVDVTLTAAGAPSSAEVSADGATVTATGDDGAVFTLQIPAGAVDRPIEITMTPVRAIDLPAGTAHLVDLQPAGIEFLATATLRIDAPGNALAVGLGYAEDGRDLHLRAGAVDGGVVELGVDHFSGYGALRLGHGELRAFEHRLPSAPGAQLMHLITVAYAAHAEGTLTLTEFEQQAGTLVRDASWMFASNAAVAPFNGSALEVALDVYAELAQIIPRLRALASGSLGGELFMLEYELRDTLSGMLNLAIDAAWQQCRDEFDYLAVFVLQRLRAYQVRYAVGVNWEVERYLEDCDRFELVLASTLDFHYYDGHDFTKWMIEFAMDVKTRIPLDHLLLEAPQDAVDIVGEVTYARHEVGAQTDPFCDWRPNGHTVVEPGDGFVLRALELPRAWWSADDVTGIRAEVDPPYMREIYELNCTYLRSQQRPDYVDVLELVHGVRTYGHDETIVLSDWQPGDELGVVAFTERRSSGLIDGRYIGNEQPQPQDQYWVSYRWELRHTPGR
jgi:putative cell wall-binding protein